MDPIVKMFPNVQAWKIYETYSRLNTHERILFIRSERIFSKNRMNLRRTRFIISTSLRGAEEQGSRVRNYSKARSVNELESKKWWKHGLNPSPLRNAFGKRIVEISLLSCLGSVKSRWWSESFPFLKLQAILRREPWLELMITTSTIQL